MCIASNIFMNADLIKNSQLLFEVDKPEELYQRMCFVLDADIETKKDILNSNYDFVVNNYSISDMVNKYYSVFMEYNN